MLRTGLMMCIAEALICSLCAMLLTNAKGKCHFGEWINSTNPTFSRGAGLLFRPPCACVQAPFLCNSPPTSLPSRAHSAHFMLSSGMIPVDFSTLQSCVIARKMYASYQEGAINRALIGFDCWSLSFSPHTVCVSKFTWQQHLFHIAICFRLTILPYLKTLILKRKSYPSAEGKRPYPRWNGTENVSKG